MQKKVDEEIALYKISVTPQRPAPEPTDEEMLIENILDPTRPAPLDDTYGVI